MKNNLLLCFFLCLSINFNFGQTFDYSTPQNIVGPAASATITIAVGTLPANARLQQVNITFGDGTTSYNAEMNKFKFVLKDPSNHSVTLLSPSSFSDLATTSSNAALKYFNIHLRDGSGYKTPKETIGSSGATYASGYPFSYGFYR